jgi:hypothetical protein
MRTTALRLSGTALLVATVARGSLAQCVNQRLVTSASTRGLAMGNSNTASRDDDVIFYGPAQLAVARGTSAAAERVSPQVANGTFASTARIATGGVGIGVQFADGTNESRCEFRQLSRVLAVVGVAQTFKRFHFGVAGKYAAEQADTAQTSRFMLDAGVSRDFSLGDFLPLTLALAVQNIGTSAVDTVQLVTPLRVALGASTGGPLGPLDLALASDIAVERNDTLSLVKHGRLIAGLGVELGYSWLDGYSFSFRAGERVPPTRTDQRHFTFGAGLVLDRVSIDYAGEDLVGFRFAHRIGVRLR